MASKEEQETTITWTALDSRAVISSLMPKIWRACERVGGEEIFLEMGVREGKKEVRFFLVPVSSVKIQAPKKLSEKRKEELREQGRRLARARQVKDS